MKQAPSSKQNDNIRVAVRVRPPLDFEMQAGNSFEKLNIDNNNKLVKYIITVLTRVLCVVRITIELSATRTTDSTLSSTPRRARDRSSLTVACPT